MQEWPEPKLRIVKVKRAITDSVQFQFVISDVLYTFLFLEILMLYTHMTRAKQLLHYTFIGSDQILEDYFKTLH